MKLDPTVMRTMNSQDFRVLEAVETGMKNHATVPPALIASLANLRHGGTHKIISSLLRDKLLSHECKRNSYDGYRLTNAGYDILALHNLKARGFIVALGQRIGTGKESDIYLAADKQGRQIVLKFHRLGRTSFRNVKKKRDYFGKATQQAHSWLFLSRLSSLKEFAFMKALHDVKFPTPTPIAHNRHILAMSLVRGLPLYQIYPKQLSVEQAADIFEQAVDIATRLARHGLVHCDLNEFNLLVDLSGIQSMATDAEDPYVRHSGQSVAGEKSLGLLSKPAWEQSLEAGDRIHEALPEPVAFLENGQPKPVVTLIDFPQMISIKHPNAEELYSHDVACLRRFFEVKLQCRIPEEVVASCSWEALMERVAKIKNKLEGQDDDEDDHIDDDVERTTRTRLDEELKASGFSQDMGHALELYYYENLPSQRVSAENLDDDDDDDDDDDAENEDRAENEEQEEADVDSETEQENTNQKSHSDDPGDGDSPAVEAENGLDVDEEDHKSALSQAEFSWMVDGADLASLTREQMEEVAKARVRQHMEVERRKARKRGAFRKKNSNKTFVKGKRVMSEFGI